MFYPAEDAWLVKEIISDVDFLIANQHNITSPPQVLLIYLQYFPLTFVYSVHDSSVRRGQLRQSLRFVRRHECLYDDAGGSLS